MDIKDIAILILGAAVILLIGYLVGSRKSNAERPVSEGTARAVEKASSNPVAQVDKKPRKNIYEKKIAWYLSQSKRSTRLFAAHTENVIQNHFSNGYENIDVAYEKYNANKDANPREALLELFPALYEAANFGSIKAALDKELEGCSEMILGGYDEAIRDVFSGQPFESESSRYALGADLRASQKAKITSILQSYCASFLGDIREIEQRRQWLQSNFNTFVVDTKGEFDWTDAAKNFGAGALAAANPLIGIPALISSFKNSSDKEKAKEARIEKYTQIFGEFEDAVNAARDKIVESSESAKSYVEKKCQEVHEQAVVTMLTELAGKGYSLEHYFAICEKEVGVLDAAEKRVFG